MSVPWVVVTAEVVANSGQGMANLALISHLARRGTPVSVVAHRCTPELLALAGVRWHPVPRPLGSAFLGDRVLAAVGRRIARQVTRERPGARVVVNGGNCSWRDVNWVHMVHHAWSDSLEGPGATTRLRLEVARLVDRRRERRIVPQSGLVIANSQRTRHDLIAHLGVEPSRIRLVYLGIDPVRFAPVLPAERAVARASLGIGGVAPVVLMVGGLGHDRKKGFDHLFAAWPTVVARRPDALLLVAGGGLVDAWRAAAEARGLATSIRFLGDVPHVERVLAASDLLVSPSRYDSYGMNVQEAVSRGVLTLVSRAAGVSERFSPDLDELVLPAPGEEAPARAGERILSALEAPSGLRDRFAALSERLRSRTWEAMAADLAVAVDEAPAP